MKRQVLIPLLALSTLTGCGIQETMRAMQCNTAMIDQSSWAICENAQAIQEANQAIEENRRQIEAVNKRLEEMSKS